jgi:hypothetical protein
LGRLLTLSSVAAVAALAVDDDSGGTLLKA